VAHARIRRAAAAHTRMGSAGSSMCSMGLIDGLVEFFIF
jgi:hypothetical protein